MRIFLIGNKSDLAKEREVSEETINSFVRQMKIDQYF
jgi:GTPase SAR1 family protein